MCPPLVNPDKSFSQTLDSLSRHVRFAAHRQPLCWNFMYHSRIVLSIGGPVWYMVRNVHCTVTIDSVLANSKTQNAFLSSVHAMFRHDCPLAVKPTSTPRRPLHKETWTDSLPIDMLPSAVCVLVVAQSSSEVPEGLMNYPVLAVSFLCDIPCRQLHLRHHSFGRDLNFQR